MKTLYIDKDFKLYVSNSADKTSIETDIFDGFCDEYIEGHIFVPEGMIMTKISGETVYGPFIQPWKNSNVLSAYQKQYELDFAQREYDKQLIIQLQNANAEYEAALSEVGVKLQ